MPMRAGRHLLAVAALLAATGGQEAPRVWQAGGSAGVSACGRRVPVPRTRACAHRACARRGPDAAPILPPPDGSAGALCCVQSGPRGASAGSTASARQRGRRGAVAGCRRMTSRTLIAGSGCAPLRMRAGAAKGSDRSLLQQVGQDEGACLARARDYHAQVCTHAPRVVQLLCPTTCACERESACACERERAGASKSECDKERERVRASASEKESGREKERARARASASARASARACESARARQRERERARERESERARERETERARERVREGERACARERER